MKLFTFFCFFFCFGKGKELLQSREPEQKSCFDTSWRDLPHVRQKRPLISRLNLEHDRKIKRTKSLWCVYKLQYAFRLRCVIW